MEKFISKSQFKARALEYFRMVQAGDTVVVTDRGKPVARVLPFLESAAQTLEQLRGSVLRYSDPMEPVGQEEWDLLP
ncbi:type II toxin-antitoxin system prevent-host-death family antitoxin [bacterium]|nr:type II toxin-antitoxin system prevent-host-death family antitoxin [bacterium]